MVLLYAQIVCREEVSDESGSKELVCEVHKNTWSHQRKRKRLQQRLQLLPNPGWRIDQSTIGYNHIGMFDRLNQIHIVQSVKCYRLFPYLYSLW